VRAQASAGAYGMWRAAAAVCQTVARQWWGGLVSRGAPAQAVVELGPATWAAYKCLASLTPARFSGDALFLMATSPMGARPPAAERAGLGLGACAHPPPPPLRLARAG